MEIDMLPLFNNSCGKIFGDKIVLASSNNENQIKSESIARLEFVGRVSLKSLFWVAISSSFFGILYLERNLDGWMYFLIFILALFFTVLSLIMVERNYHILLLMKDGTKRTISVDKSNKKDARNFVAAFRAKRAKK
jgi:ABC-type lipoprotein release transport system permease subunit